MFHIGSHLISLITSHTQQQVNQSAHFCHNGLFGSGTDQINCLLEAQLLVIQCMIMLIIRKALTETLNVMSAAKAVFLPTFFYSQLWIVGLKENKECKLIVLPPPPRSAFNSTLQYTADAFWNLTHLLQLYHSVWRLMELHEGDIVGSDLAKLDFLEIVYSQFSNQVERYLQVHRCSCKGIICHMHQYINKESIRNVM